MAGNTTGNNFRVTTFGESHGPAIGAVIDGVPAGLELSEADLQTELDRRRPGQSNLTTQRAEADRAEILSGIFEGKTTGAPVAVVIRNCDQHSKDYSNLANLFRPGHADSAWQAKFGVRDYRGGGRSSGRETASRVAAGAIAKKILRALNIEIHAYAIEVAGIAAETRDFAEIEKNPVRCADPTAAKKMEAAILAAAAEGDSVGGIVECEVSGVPAGWGEPVFDKLDAELAKAMMGIGAVKGVEFGSGFAAARMRGSENNPPGHSGGISGGISNGEKIVFRVAVKPTPSISKPQQTVDKDGNPTICEIKGRHDPCIVPRIVPVIEAMAAIVLADFR
ncbi:MAG: chorismate synthase [Victivallaceae bacterium]|nr:chorismate synthase [Victivallaceae bacterium]